MTNLISQTKGKAKRTDQRRERGDRERKRERERERGLKVSEVEK